MSQVFPPNHPQDFPPAAATLDGDRLFFVETERGEAVISGNDPDLERGGERLEQMLAEGEKAIAEGRMRPLREVMDEICRRVADGDF